MTNTTTTAMTLSEMKAQVNKKKAVKAVKATTKAATPKAEPKAKAPVKVSTDKKAKAEKKVAAPKVTFEDFTAKVAGIFKVKLEDATNKSGKAIKSGSNKELTLSTVAGKNMLIVKDKAGKIICEIHPNKAAGYKLAIPNNKAATLNIPKGTTTKEHPTWKDVFVAEPKELVSQLLA